MQGASHFFSADPFPVPLGQFPQAERCPRRTPVSSRSPSRHGSVPHRMGVLWASVTSVSPVQLRMVATPVSSQRTTTSLAVGPSLVHGFAPVVPVTGMRPSGRPRVAGESTIPSVEDRSASTDGPLLLDAKSALVPRSSPEYLRVTVCPASAAFRQPSDKASPGLRSGLALLSPARGTDGVARVPRVPASRMGK